MRNEILWFLMMLVNFLCITFAYKNFGKIGLYIWIPISTILANVQVVMLVKLFGMDATLGNILYAGGFLVTDILSENYGKKDAQLAVKIGFFSLIAMTLIMQFAINFVPMDVDNSLEIFNGVKGIFSLMPRLMLASLTAYFVSQNYDILAYEFLRDKKPSKKFIWLRNNLSTMTSQFIDTLIFTLIAFYNVYSNDVLVGIVISTYVIKFIVAFCDTPFIYIASYLYNNNKIKEIK